MGILPAVFQQLWVLLKHIDTTSLLILAITKRSGIKLDVLLLLWCVWYVHTCARSVYYAASSLFLGLIVCFVIAQIVFAWECHTWVADEKASSPQAAFNNYTFSDREYFFLLLIDVVSHYVLVTCYASLIYWYLCVHA